jgi:hypothetical protein
MLTTATLIPALLMAVAVICAGLAGFVLARYLDQDREVGQSDAMRTEMSRMRRRAVAAEDTGRSLRTQVERQRRRLREV